MACEPSNPVSPSARQSAPGPWVRTAEPLCWLLGAGHETRTHPSYRYDCIKRRGFPQWVLQLTLQGQGFYQDSRGRTLLGPGMAFLNRIPGRFHYGYPPECREPYEQVYVSLSGADVDCWARRLTRSFGHVLRFGAENEIAGLMLAIVRQRAEQLRQDRYLASAQVYQLLMAILSTLNRTRVETAPLLREAMALIAWEGLESGFNVKTLAERLDCSREHLARLFRQTAGVGPLDYLTQHRLRSAATRLRDSDEKLQEIARRCGFSGANYFCRVFRKYVGVSPAQFRTRPWLSVP